MGLRPNMTPTAIMVKKSPKTPAVINTISMALYQNKRARASRPAFFADRAAASPAMSRVARELSAVS